MHGQKKGRGSAAPTASSPLHVWYPFTLPPEPPGAGRAAPGQRGRGQEGQGGQEGRDRSVRDADSKRGMAAARQGPPSTDAASPPPTCPAPALIRFGVPFSLLLLLLPSLSWSWTNRAEASGAGQLSQHPNITQTPGWMWLLLVLPYWGPQATSAATLSVIL